MRDYIHIEDLGEAHILGLERATEPGRAPHLQPRQRHRLLGPPGDRGRARVTGREIPVKEEGRRPGDPAALVASSQRIRDELGWVPRKPEIETMIEDAWNWFQARPQGYAD